MRNAIHLRLLPALLTLAAIATAACGANDDGPPSIVVDRTACSQCTMLVSEIAYASAYRAGSAGTRVFDDIGCMLEAMKRDGVRAGDAALRVWVHDAQTNEWIDGAAAVFVIAPEVKTPMGGGIIAYRDAARAERVATEHHGRLVASVSDLMQQRGDGR
jgi:copper chaperone NosL